MNNSKETITIVTFLRKEEKVNKSFTDFIALLNQSNQYVIETRVYAETDSFEILGADRAIFSKIIVQPRQTKFTRIRNMLKEVDTKYLLCIDSDIELLPDKLIQFLSETLSRPCDLAWGRILCHKSSNFTEQLVRIDKILSHYFLRPVLWYTGLGVTIPGQIMLIRKEAFSQMECQDTFLDDIALGLHAKSNKLDTRYKSILLGYETPSSTFTQLFSQRLRWAKGFATIIKSNYNKRTLLYLLIHGIAYHLLIPLITLFLILGLLYYPIEFTTILLFLSMTTCIVDYRYAIPVILYPFIYTILHIEWGTSVLYHLFFNFSKN